MAQEQQESLVFGGIRNDVAVFAIEMERRLRLTVEKKGSNGWKDGDVDHILEHLEAAYDMLRSRVEVARLSEGSDARGVLDYALDLANHAMMLASACGVLDLQEGQG